MQRDAIKYGDVRHRSYCLRLKDIFYICSKFQTYKVESVSPESQKFVHGNILPSKCAGVEYKEPHKEAAYGC